MPLAIDVALHLHRVYDYEVIYGSRTNATPGGMAHSLFLLFVTEYYIGNPISWHFIAFRQGFGLFGVLAKRLAFPACWYSLACL